MLKDNERAPHDEYNNKTTWNYDGDSDGLVGRERRDVSDEDHPPFAHTDTAFFAPSIHNSRGGLVVNADIHDDVFVIVTCGLCGVAEYVAKYCN